MDNIEFLPPINGRFVLALVAAISMAWLAVRIGSGNANKLSRAWPIYIIRGMFALALVVLLANPVRVTEQEGAIEPAEIFMMLDASESMAIGDQQATRWDQAVDLIRKSSELATDSAAAKISLYRFGRRLKAIRSPDELGLLDGLNAEGMGIAFTADTPSSSESLSMLADEPDTQMLVALRQVSSRFGRSPPAAVVLFSDGRARDEGQTEQVAEAFRKLGVPIHVVPVGNSNSGGDIALVSFVLPRSARKQTSVHAQAFLRSYGFDGQEVEIFLDAMNYDGQRIRRLAKERVTIQSGFQPIPLSFQCAEDTEQLRVSVSGLTGEVSTDNNQLDAELLISREKIRILYLEGSRMRGLPEEINGELVLRGPETYLTNALSEDDDIDCRTVQVSVEMLTAGSTQLGAFPKSVAELSSFDAIILSDVPKQTFTEQQLQWIESWVRQRGGGFCMVGGGNSFGSGDWHNSVVARMLPVSLNAGTDFRAGLQSKLQIRQQQPIHPFFRLLRDERQNRDVLDNFPKFQAANIGLLPKPNLTSVLAVANAGSQDGEPSGLLSPEGIRRFLGNSRASDATPEEFAAITVGQYGKGRTMAVPFPITSTYAEQFVQWGRAEGENDLYAQFWRNVVYWLTENSYVGRRRLVATTDKRYYGPGDSMSILASAFDENSNETSEYRLTGLLEPQSFDDIESDYSIVRWPNNVPREEETDSPFAIWGERFEIPIKQVGGQDVYQIDLALAENLPAGTANQSLRLELTAFEGKTQVDSTSVAIQVLHDPFEQQNPFPNHPLLERLAKASGGRVLANEQEIAETFQALPIVRGPSETKMAPLWSSGWLLGTLLGLLTAEWCYRRWIGLA